MPDHDQKALDERLVETELMFQLLDQLRINALRAGITRHRRVLVQLHHLVGWRRGLARRRTAETRGGGNIGAVQFGDDLLNGPPGAACTIRKLSVIIPSKVGMISKRRRRI